MPKCAMPACNNDVELGKNGKWKMHCSLKCRGQHNSIIGSEKRKQTCLDRFGATTNLKTNENKLKSKATLMKNYGVEHQMYADTVKQKIRNTCVDTYGVDNPSKSSVIKQKKIDTSILHYGVSHPLQSSLVQDGRKEFCIEKYGVDHYSKTDEYKVKFAETCIERYGVDNPRKAEIVKAAIKATWERKYGREIHPAQQHITQDTINKLQDRSWLEENKNLSSTFLADKLGVTYYTVLYAYKRAAIIRANSCSAGENELAEFIRSIYKGNINLNVRNIIPPKEIDIFLPDINLAFEFDGLFWHSELQGKDKQYHENKTQLCNASGIQLIHVFEDEWLHKRDIVKSRITHLLGNSKKIYARKCKIVEINYKACSDFLNANHIQGFSTSSVQYALEYNGDIVAVMTLGKSRYNTQYQWELIRFANKIGYTIVGAASRLLTKFIKDYNPESIISYSNKRWNTGNVYSKLGFAKCLTNSPSYRYTKNYRMLESMHKYQKKKLKKLLPVFDASKTEWENMKANGYDRIWDCGSDVYGWTKPQLN